jgi:hypothetical protein
MSIVAKGFTAGMNLSPTTATYGCWNSNSNPNSENDHVT